MRWRRAAAAWGRGLGLNALAVLPVVPAVRNWLGCPAEWWHVGFFVHTGWMGFLTSVADGLVALVVLDLALTLVHVWWHGPLARLHAYGPHHRVPEAEINWTTGQVWGPWEPLMGVPTVWAVILGLGVPLGPALFATGTMLLWALWVHTPPRRWHVLIGWLFVTPMSHRVHHSPDPALARQNCGFVFSLWDRMLT